MSNRMMIKQFNRKVQVPYLKKELNARGAVYDDKENGISKLKAILKETLGTEVGTFEFELMGEGNNAGEIIRLGKS